MKRVLCKSGIMGWQAHLQDNWKSFENFMSCCENYDIHTRLGYKTIEGAWKSNPIVQGSIEPSDLRKVKPSTTKNIERPEKYRTSVQMVSFIHDCSTLNEGLDYLHEGVEGGWINLNNFKVLANRLFQVHYLTDSDVPI